MSSVNLTCAICTESYKNFEAIVSTDCGHVFHAACMNEARKRSTSCPACRSIIRATYPLHLTFKEDKQIAELKSKIKEQAKENNLLQQQWEQKEQHYLKLMEQLTEKDAEMKELVKKIESAKAQIETRSKEIELKTNEIQKLQAELNCADPQGTTTMLLEEIKILKEKNNFMSKELNKEIHVGMQMSMEKMKLEKMLQQFQSLPSMPKTSPSLLATPPATPPSVSTSKSAPQKKKPAAKKQVSENTEHSESSHSHKSTVSWVVIKNVKAGPANEVALKRYVLNLTDIMDLFYSGNDVEQVTVIKRKQQVNTMTLIAKFKDLNLKAKFLSRQDSLKENEDTKDLLLEEYVTNYTQHSLYHYAKTLKPLGYKHVYCSKNVVYVKKSDESQRIRIYGRDDVDKLKNSNQTQNPPELLGSSSNLDEEIKRLTALLSSIESK